MRKTALGLLISMCIPAGALLAAEQTWKNVPIVDTQCVDKVKDDPDTHTTTCALQCAKGGYGMLTPDGRYIKFDSKGNEKVVQALKTTKMTDHLRAAVTGSIEGDSVKLSSISLTEEAK